MSTSTLAFPPAAEMDVLVSAAEIADRVAELGRQITADYEGQSTGHPLVLIGVLKGAAIFLSDLARAITHRQHVRLRRRLQLRPRARLLGRGQADQGHRQPD